VIANRAAQSQQLTERPARKALATRHQKVCNLHLRQLSVENPRGGERINAREKGAVAGAAPQ
jgi:hypothetical protein